MRRCFIVLGEPGRCFIGVHHTLDGAVHEAAVQGATSLPDGGAITVDAVSSLMKRSTAVLLGCEIGGEFEGVIVERHAIMV